MAAYTYLVDSRMITTEPCLLHSIIVGNDGSNVGWLDVFDARNADAAYKVARLYGEGKTTKQYHWKGLELDRGLYIEFTSTIEWATIEWEPAPPGTG